MSGPSVRSRAGVVGRLLDAGNAHQLDDLVACFEPGVRSDTPAHSSRSFVGSDQVRRNWGAIFAAVPDIMLTLVDEAGDADRVWCELAFDGTRTDGIAHHMRGVVIFGVRDDRIESVRFYMEPAVDDGIGPDEGVARALAAVPAAATARAGEAAR